MVHSVFLSSTFFGLSLLMVILLASTVVTAYSVSHWAQLSVPGAVWLPSELLKPEATGVIVMHYVLWLYV
jgi:hypothetical protein